MKKVKSKVLVYYPFWVGLIMSISIIGIGIRYDLKVLPAIAAYLIGFWNLGKFH